MYVELSEMQKDLESLSSTKLYRSCEDIRLDHPGATSGTYTIDPNQGSQKDAIKTYCTFGGHGLSQTCVSNSTLAAQLPGPPPHQDLPVHSAAMHSTRTLQVGQGRNTNDVFRFL